MKAVTRVELHCHSLYSSDGTLPPRDLAESLVAGGVAAASLTDHDTADGLAEFSRALLRRGVGFIPGVEITVRFQGEDLHLLAYGFDPDCAGFQATLQSIRQARDSGVHSIAESIRQKGAAPQEDSGSAAPAGQIEAGEAIALIHRAGGRAFLAHPLIYRADPPVLRPLLAALKEQGLDGLEAVYAAYTEEQRESLCALAKEAGLLVSAGTDLHDRKSPGPSGAGIDMPTGLWKAFRDAVCAGNGLAAQGISPSPHPRHRLDKRHFLFHIMFPTLLAISLFIAAIYSLFLPAFEHSLLERKREMIRELTNSAWSILASFERDERAGRLTRSQAQAMARSRIASLRYGREGKDYFWLQDMRPRIIMHPYRPDLNGKDVSGFRDMRGERIFVEFADLVRRGREGYIAYVWQWKDDPSRLVPKESYIKGFQPWGWIIGTGIYIEDVKEEIGRIEARLVRTALGIALIVAALLLYVMRQSLSLERERSEAEESLRESTERYRALVEATTEGTLLVMDERCRYANPIFLEILGYTQREMELLDLHDIIPETGENARAWESLHRLIRGEEAVEGFDAVLRRRGGGPVECVLASSRIAFGEGNGFILLARNIGSEAVSAASGQNRRSLQQVADGTPVGLFRARASSRATVIEANPAAEGLMRPSRPSEDSPAALAGLFRDGADYEDFRAELQREGKAARRLHVTAREPRTLTLALTAQLLKDEQGNPRYIDGTVQDITPEENRAARLKSQIETLQTSLLFLHEPVNRIGRASLFCELSTSIQAASALMTSRQSSAVLVESESGAAVGIVTDRDLRERVVAAGLDRKESVSRIMTAPLISIPESAALYEALLLMEQKGIQHLAVADETGRIVGVIRSKELLQFRSYGPIVLTREIRRSGSAEEVIAACRRTSELARSLLESNAHPRHVTEMLASVCDAATERFLDLAQAGLGPAPVPFVFLALGSQGRQEMTLASDQDNAILFEPPDDPAMLPQAQDYLGRLSALVCGWLARAGYPFCQGNVMAQNPRWCQPLAVWKDYFSDWIERAEPQQLLEFTIFFDFRPVYGPEEPVGELRRHIADALTARPAFFPHFAQNSLLFKPPARLFGRIRVGGEHPGTLDLKEALMPIVSFARLYALRHGLEETHTLDRLEALTRAGALPEASCQEIIAAYDFLIRLRLQRQSALLHANQPPDNSIGLRSLGQLDETLLTQSFAQISAVQKRISFDFLGGAS
ncbi:MAG: cache domain-containing protein [Armatimonadetes bacterium]|nr:cache domain-containing protein [Armatimonadota bacterium]